MSGNGRAGVLLDIDGTLLDTNYLHVVAWHRAFRRAGHDVAMHRIHRLIGMGGDRLVDELIGEASSEVADGWAEEFHHLRPEIRLLPGAQHLVRQLHACHQAVVLASSAPADDVDWFRRLLDVDDALAGATSSDDADGSKPDPDIFDVAVDRFDLDRSQTVAIGDAIWDARAARRAGIGFVGVESGGTDAAALRDEGAWRVGRDAAALADVVVRAGVEGLRSNEGEGTTS